MMFTPEPEEGGGVLPGALGNCAPLKAAVRNGAEVTPEPRASAHPCVFGPAVQPHQFCEPLTVPAPRFWMPTEVKKLLRVADTCPPGALNTTPSSSWLIVFWEITVPVTGARLEMLI